VIHYTAFSLLWLLFKKKNEVLALAAFSDRIEVVCALRLAGVSIGDDFDQSGTGLISINWG